MNLFFIRMFFVFLLAFLTAFLSTLLESSAVSFIVFIVGAFLSGSIIKEMSAPMLDSAALLVFWIAVFTSFLFWFGI